MLAPFMAPTGSISIFLLLMAHSLLDCCLRLYRWGALPPLSELRKDRARAFARLSKAVAILRAQEPIVRDEDDLAFFSVVEDIASNRYVLSMATIKHHRSSTLDHSLIVSQVSWNLALAFGFDAVSTARGALLHDFFLYDWRSGEQPHHPTAHPVIALENARRMFSLNGIEEDVILTHMWPASRRFYTYRESFLVSCIDKLATLWDLGPLMRGIISKT